MTYTYWTVSLMPGEGWSVHRMVKRGTLWAREEVCYDRLIASERDQVLDDDSAFVLGRALLEASDG